MPPGVTFFVYLEDAIAMVSIDVTGMAYSHV